MDLESLIEKFIDLGAKAYKKLYRNTPEGRKLDRHEEVVLLGQEFSCWREYSVYRMAEQISLWVPSTQVEVILDGNDSVLQLSGDEESLTKVQAEIEKFMEETQL